MIIDHTWSVFIDIAMNIDRQWSLIISIITHDQWSLPWNAVDHTWSVLINGLYCDPYFVHIFCRTRKWIAAEQIVLLPCCCHAVAILVNNSLLYGHMWDFPHVFLSRRKRNCRWIFCVVYVVNENFLMYLLHRKQNCRWTTAEVPILDRIIFSMIVSQCFDKSFK